MINHWRKKYLKYLIIDWGASSIKTALYDSALDSISLYKEIESPFIKQFNIHIEDIKKICQSILSDYNFPDFVASCSIKNGTFKNNIYYSWKNGLYQNKSDVISPLFIDTKLYHIHRDHSLNGSNEIKILGNLKNSIFLSCLGDTDCVIRSKSINRDQAIINMGTGSQIIYSDSIISFIPSGRVLNIFRSFFTELGVDIFDIFKNITLKDLINSNLEIDLNIFAESINFNNYGKIMNITEHNFTFKNFAHSLFRCYLDQYIPLLRNNLQTIFLSGGIPNKYPVIKDYFQYKTKFNFQIDSNISTIYGLINSIKEFEKNKYS